MTLEKFNTICLIWGIVAVLTFVLLQIVDAPYGRHVKKGWGPQLSNKLGWLIMEFPSFAIMLYFYQFKSIELCQLTEFTMVISLF